MTKNLENIRTLTLDERIDSQEDKSIQDFTDFINGVTGKKIIVVPTPAKSHSDVKYYSEKLNRYVYVEIKERKCEYDKYPTIILNANKIQDLPHSKGDTKENWKCADFFYIGYEGRYAVVISRANIDNLLKDKGTNAFCINTVKKTQYNYNDEYINQLQLSIPVDDKTGRYYHLYYETNQQY